MIMGYCKHHYHEGEIDSATFEYRGCWMCWQHFERRGNWLFTDEACEKFGVSMKTIYRWIKKGKLDATLFEVGRTTTDMPKRIYVIWDKNDEGR